MAYFESLNGKYKPFFPLSTIVLVPAACGVIGQHQLCWASTPLVLMASCLKKIIRKKSICRQTGSIRLSVN